MKQINNYITEKLHLGKNTDTLNDMRIERFKDYYKGLPDKISTYIYDKYVKATPFSKEANEVRIGTAFEILFSIAAMLVDDGWKSPYKYKLLGYKPYINSYGEKGNNPYDLDWYDEELSSGKDFLDYLQTEWIPENYTEFEHIFDICLTYKNILTIDKIQGFFENVET